MLKDGEKLEKLSPEISLIVSREYSFGTDAILLADFSMPRQTEKVCEFGTGCGIIPMFWKSRHAPNSIVSLDIQENACEQAARSVHMNALDKEISVARGDIRRVRELLPIHSFDLAVMNPPYKPVNSGIESREESDRIARHEIFCTISDVADAASAVLNFGGRFCLCHRPERLCDVITSMRSAGLEPKKLRFVTQRRGLPPWLFLIEGKKGGKSGIIIMPELLIESENRELSDEMLRIYGKYKEGCRR